MTHFSSCLERTAHTQRGWAEHWQQQQQNQDREPEISSRKIISWSWAQAAWKHPGWCKGRRTKFIYIHYIFILIGTSCIHPALLIHLRKHRAQGNLTRWQITRQFVYSEISTASTPTSQGASRTPIPHKMQTEQRESSKQESKFGF